ncbi:hypothetical protein RD110_10275 [Rhodoferax koreense]|uniref:Phage coat protein n=1 Tax=Rhodoferax koreensis TaxID=1842727 RepID=A0A1P8JUV9_9BURK|nr:hypothetical protein [Rhodoferax koreense]APW37525.1 hypothetical protein RD110_10275 [Rhodoferax koreense]
MRRLIWPAISQGSNQGKTMFVTRKVALKFSAIPAAILAAAGSAMAAAPTIDTTAATDGIAAATTAVGGVIAAMITYQVGKWALMKVKGLFGR